MLKSQKNTKKQGDVGLGIAIAYFCKEGFNVSIPLTDSQEYDLVVENDGNLKKVQVKTTSFKTEYGIYQVMLKTCGGNKSSNTIKNFDPEKVDLLFVVNELNEQYLIPTFKEMPVTSLNLNGKYTKYKLN